MLEHQKQSHSATIIPLFVVIVIEGIHPGRGESAGFREGTGFVASGACGQILSWQAIQKVPGKPEAWWLVGTSQQLSLLGSQKENLNNVFPEVRTPRFLGPPPTQHTT